MTEVYIQGTGTAVPKNTFNQKSIRAVVEALFSDTVHDLDRLLGVFSHTHIQQRHLIEQPEWYAADHNFGDSNAAYVKAATTLSLAAARDALSASKVSVAEVAGIVVASTTGLMTPSLDAVIAQELQLPATVSRSPLFGLGCAGGVSGLARAAEMCIARGGRPVLFVAVEICSATFQKNDTSKSNLIGSSIFADGAAAVVLSSEPSQLRVVDSHSHLFPNTYDIMGWDFTDSGFKVRFSRDIPTFVREQLPHMISEACQGWDIAQGDVNSWITHPGGAKVLEAFAEAVGADESDLKDAYDVLRDHGNMSSASVLFVLHHMLSHGNVNTGYAIMSALGPGFSSEHLLLYFRK